MSSDKLNPILFLTWEQTLKAFDVDPIIITNTFTSLATTYSTGDRHYHNLKHIYHVLSIIDILQVEAEDLTAIKLAAWFHDVVYETQRQDNEERSAEYAIELLKNLKIPRINIETITHLILQTKHHQADDINSQILLDADLAILATPLLQYQDYADAIRQEYAWVSDPDYIIGRKNVLQRFLQRPRIYFTSLMFESAEKSARANLEWEISNW